MESDGKGRKLHQLVIASSILALLALAGCAIMVYKALSQWEAYPDGNVSLVEISKTTDVKFPAGSWLVHGVNTSFEDTTMTALVEMDRSTVSGFVSSMLRPRRRKGSTKMSSIGRLGITNGISGAPRWWNPDSCKRFQAIRIESHGKNSELLQVLIGLDDPQHAVVYVDYGAD